jgi:hypothetical protein
MGRSISVVGEGDAPSVGKTVEEDVDCSQLLILCGIKNKNANPKAGVFVESW